MDQQICSLLFLNMTAMIKKSACTNKFSFLQQQISNKEVLWKKNKILMESQISLYLVMTWGWRRAASAVFLCWQWAKGKLLLTKFLLDFCLISTDIINFKPDFDLRRKITDKWTEACIQSCVQEIPFQAQNCATAAHNEQHLQLQVSCQCVVDFKPKVPP